MADNAYCAHQFGALRSGRFGAGVLVLCLFPFTFFEYGSRLAQMLGKTRSRLTTAYKIWVLLGSLPRLTTQMDRYGL
ncbi:hypothetical protein [uncultured Acidaminococcus sp.]|uniref:hypothetical protein n=1 Tax=uncultured Acidaminococcus sp. TaxID=352152 RepID=UPI0025CE9D84|nr:hypothetical protein [uncultured Acidaminococcus sp.]